MRKILILATALLSMSAGVVHADTDHPIRDSGHRHDGGDTTQSTTTGYHTAHSVDDRVSQQPLRRHGVPPGTTYSPGWDVVRMSRYAYRESRCDPGVHNTAGAQGLLQITRINYAYLRAHGTPGHRPVAA